jgi:hypothetical protein
MKRKPLKCFSLQPCQRQFDIRASHRSRLPTPANPANPGVVRQFPVKFSAE